MRHILIVFPKLDEYQTYHYMPFSALAVASALVAKGDEVKIFDQRTEPPRSIDALLEWSEQVIFTAYTGYQLSEAYRLAVKHRRQADLLGVKLILGGPHATVRSLECSRNGVFDEIRVGYAEHGEYVIPWELVNIKKYINPKTERFMYLTSYGCPGHCTFCATKRRNPWVLLPIFKIKMDINYLMALYPFKECVIFDATVFTDKKRAKEINEIMLYHDLKWFADARACELDSIDEKYFKDFEGLVQLTIGLESGSQRVIQNMQKGRNHLKIFESVARMMAKTHIRMVSGVVLGTPGETPEDLIATIKFIKHIRSINQNFFISSTFFRPLPDTIMADQTKMFGYQEPNSLAGWAELGRGNHYQYNTYVHAPWIYREDEYRRIYEEFRKECAYMFI